jgi:hypothetical protein
MRMALRIEQYDGLLSFPQPTIIERCRCLIRDERPLPPRERARILHNL